MHTTALTSTAALAFSALGGATPTGETRGDWTKKGCDSPFEFKSTYHVIATPQQVFNDTPAVSTPGQSGGIGYYNQGINSHLDVICYVCLPFPSPPLIPSSPLTPPRTSPSTTSPGPTNPSPKPPHTSTKAPSGPPAPPRLALPDPVGDDKLRRSIGCMTGPFTTGISANGVDTGTGFKFAQIEANPAGFFTNSHTKMYVPGVVRGQLA